MLLVAEKGREEEVQKVFEKWDLPCSVIGEVTDDGFSDFICMENWKQSFLPMNWYWEAALRNMNREYRNLPI